MEVPDEFLRKYLKYREKIIKQLKKKGLKGERFLEIADQFALNMEYGNDYEKARTFSKHLWVKVTEKKEFHQAEIEKESKAQGLKAPTGKALARESLSRALDELKKPKELVSLGDEFKKLKSVIGPLNEKSESSLGWCFSTIETAVYHYYKHHILRGNKDLSPKEYFKLIDQVIKDEERCIKEKKAEDPLNLNAPIRIYLGKYRVKEPWFPFLSGSQDKHWIFASKIKKNGGFHVMTAYEPINLNRFKILEDLSEIDQNLLRKALILYLD